MVSGTTRKEIIMRMNKGIGLLLAVIMVMTAALTGCKSGGKSGNNDIKIFFTVCEDSDWYKDWAEMAKQRAKEDGVQMDIDYAEKSIEKQDEQIKNAVADGYNVIMCSPVSPEVASELKSAAGDVPIVFVNNAPDDRKLVADHDIYVASDENTAGEFQAEYILKQFADKDEINVVLLKGSKGSSGTAGRTNGVKEALKASGKKINYVFEDYADFNPDRAKEIYSTFLKNNVQVDCIACNNDNMALGAIAACEEAKIDVSSIVILGVDASADGCQAIADGKMDFTVFQNTKGQARAATEAAMELARGKSIRELEGAAGDGKYIWIPFEKVDSSNVTQYQ